MHDWEFLRSSYLTRVYQGWNLPGAILQVETMQIHPSFNYKIKNLISKKGNKSCTCYLNIMDELKMFFFCCCFFLLLLIWMLSVIFGWLSGPPLGPGSGNSVGRPPVLRALLSPLSLWNGALYWCLLWQRGVPGCCEEGCARWTHLQRLPHTLPAPQCS